MAFQIKSVWICIHIHTYWKEVWQNNKKKRRMSAWGLTLYLTFQSYDDNGGLRKYMLCASLLRDRFSRLFYLVLRHQNDLSRALVSPPNRTIIQVNQLLHFLWMLNAKRVKLPLLGVTLPRIDPGSSHPWRGYSTNCAIQASHPLRKCFFYWLSLCPTAKS